MEKGDRESVPHQPASPLRSFDIDENTDAQCKQGITRCEGSIPVISYYSVSSLRFIDIPPCFYSDSTSCFGVFDTELQH